MFENLVQKIEKLEKSAARFEKDRAAAEKATKKRDVGLREHLELVRQLTIEFLKDKSEAKKLLKKRYGTLPRAKSGTMQWRCPCMRCSSPASVPSQVAGFPPSFSPAVDAATRSSSVLPPDVGPLKLKPKLLSPIIFRFGAAKLVATASVAREEYTHFAATLFCHPSKLPDLRNAPNRTPGL
jgi:hypothetical protein